MAKIVLTTTIIILLNILIGCGGYDRGQSQIVPTPPASAPVTVQKGTGEVDIVEQVVINRQTYRSSLEMLIQYYTSVGNYMKLQWAKKELEGLDTMPKYKYIVEGEKNENLKASTPIPEADRLYQEAAELQRKGEQLVLVKDDNLLRMALDKYDQLISNYPSSDKIDDAAFKSGEIHEHFRDYTLALLYYKRAFQWNPATPYPARFKAATISDKYLHNRSDALELYQQALEKEGKQYLEWRLLAENRVKELQKLGEESK
jgi:tetratricopeptide (TPR) repeat protein